MGPHPVSDRMYPLRMFVVLEGLSGCGKSTVSRGLEEEGWIRVSPPDDRFSVVRKWLDDDEDQLSARFLLFAAGVAASAVTVRSALAAGRSVVADSWIHRTLATHHVLGCKIGFADFDWLPTPDHVFFLDCSEERRRARRVARGTRDSHWKHLCEMRSEEIRYSYLHLFGSIVRINADVESRAVADRIKEVVNHA